MATACWMEAKKNADLTVKDVVGNAAVTAAAAIPVAVPTVAAIPVAKAPDVLSAFALVTASTRPTEHRLAGSDSSRLLLCQDCCY